MDAEVTDINGRDFHIFSEEGYQLGPELITIREAYLPPLEEPKPPVPKTATELWKIRKEAMKEIIIITVILLFVVLPLAALTVWGLLFHLSTTLAILFIVLLLAGLVFVFTNPSGGSGSGGTFIFIST